MTASGTSIPKIDSFNTKIFAKPNHTLNNKRWANGLTSSPTAHLGYLAHTIVRGFFGNRHIVNVGFFNTRAADTHKFCFGA